MAEEPGVRGPFFNCLVDFDRLPLLAVGVGPGLASALENPFQPFIAISCMLATFFSMCASSAVEPTKRRSVH